MAKDLHLDYTQIGTMIMSSRALLGNFLGGWNKGITDTFVWLYMAVGILFACGALLSLLLIPENKYLRGTSIF